MFSLNLLITAYSLLHTVLCIEGNDRESTRYSSNIQHPIKFDLGDADANCITSHVTRYDMARGRHQPVSFSTSPRTHQDIELPAITPMNATAGEQWEFDGVSEDGMQAVIFGFYRDPNYSFLGTGNLRAYAEFALGDGSRYAVVDYAEESTIISCPGPQGGTHGTWKGDGFIYTFFITADMSMASISMDSDEAKVNVTLKSITTARYPDGSTWPGPSDPPPGTWEGPNTLTVPYFYWFEPIPAAETLVEGVIEDQRVSWAGVGGHERLWGAFNWRTCLSGLVIVRFRVGPFAVSLWEFMSGRTEGLSFFSLVLFEEGKKIFSSSRGANVSATDADNPETEDYFMFRKIYSGESKGTTTANLKDKATGVQLVLHSPQRQLRWSFTVTFKNVGFEYVLTEGMGGTGYSGVAVGGLATGIASEESGPAFVEIMKFPDEWWLLPDNFVD